MKNCIFFIILPLFIFLSCGPQPEYQKYKISGVQVKFFDGSTETLGTFEFTVTYHKNYKYEVKPHLEDGCVYPTNLSKANKHLCGSCLEAMACNVRMVLDKGKVELVP